MRLLDARGVEVRIAGRTILHPASIAVEAGELAAIVGPNGAGKSTLVRALAGLQPTVAGEIHWGGTPLAGLRGRALARHRAFVPQRGRVPEGVTVADAVLIGRSPHIGPLRRPGRHDHDAVERAMRRTRVDGFAERMLGTLSGGELQRVQIAVALAQEAPVLIADEPTSHLDLGATADLAQLLRELTHDGLGVILVLHDLALAAALADRLLILADGHPIVSGAPGDVLDQALLREVWGVDAQLTRDAEGRTGLHVDWAGGLPLRR